MARAFLSNKILSSVCCRQSLNFLEEVLERPLYFMLCWGYEPWKMCMCNFNKAVEYVYIEQVILWITSSICISLYICQWYALYVILKLIYFCKFKCLMRSAILVLLIIKLPDTCLYTILSYMSDYKSPSPAHTTWCT